MLFKLRNKTFKSTISFSMITSRVITGAIRPVIDVKFFMHRMTFKLRRKSRKNILLKFLLFSRSLCSYYARGRDYVDADNAYFTAFFCFVFCFRISNASVLVLSLFVKNKDYFRFVACVNSFMPC